MTEYLLKAITEYYKDFEGAEQVQCDIIVWLLQNLNSDKAIEELKDWLDLHDRCDRCGRELIVTKARQIDGTRKTIKFCAECDGGKYERPRYLIPHY